MHYSTSSLFNMTVAVSAFVMMMAFFGSVPPVHGFTLTAQPASQSMAAAETRQCLTLGMAADDSSGADPNEIVGKRIIVTGDVNGGYLRTCISNEAGRFRRLLGTMSPPDDEGEAEIYVEVSCTPARIVAGHLGWYGFERRADDVPVHSLLCIGKFVFPFSLSLHVHALAQTFAAQHRFMNTGVYPYSIYCC